jgi:segregation and condensation protein B
MREVETTSETPPPRRIVEALLFVGGAALSARRAGEIVRSLEPEQLRRIVDELNRDYRRQGRPYSIQAGPDGYTLALKSQFRGVRGRLAGSPREARLTAAALDVLALIAYRQPLLKSDIDAQRGTDSRSPLQQLVRLGLISMIHEPGSKTAAHVTTARFLELFGLDSLEDLPQTDDLRRL